MVDFITQEGCSSKEIYSYSSLFHEACIAGNFLFAKLMLDKYAYSTSVEESGLPPLHMILQGLALCKQSLECQLEAAKSCAISLLLKSYDPNSLEFRAITPLDFLMENCGSDEALASTVRVWMEILLEVGYELRGVLRQCESIATYVVIDKSAPLVLPVSGLTLQQWTEDKYQGKGQNDGVLDFAFCAPQVGAYHLGPPITVSDMTERRALWKAACCPPWTEEWRLRLLSAYYLKLRRSKCRAGLWRHYIDGGSDGYTLSYVNAHISIYQPGTGVPNPKSSRRKRCFWQPSCFSGEVKLPDACYSWYDFYGPAEEDFCYKFPTFNSHPHYGAADDQPDEFLARRERIRRRRAAYGNLKTENPNTQNGKNRMIKDLVLEDSKL